MSNINKIETYFNTRILNSITDEFFPVITGNTKNIEHNSNEECKKELKKLIKLIFFGKNFENFEELNEDNLKDFNKKLINNSNNKEINDIKNIFHKYFNDSGDIFTKINKNNTKWTKLFSLLNNSLEEFFNKNSPFNTENFSIIQNCKLLEIITNNGDIERIKKLIKISSENEKIFDSIISFVGKNIYAETSDENLSKKLDFIIEIFDILSSITIFSPKKDCYEYAIRKNVFSTFINNLTEFIERDNNYEKIIKNFQIDLFKKNINIIKSLDYKNFKRFINLAFCGKINYEKINFYQKPDAFLSLDHNFLNIFLEDEEKIYINKNYTEIFPFCNNYIDLFEKKITFNSVPNSNNNQNTDNREQAIQSNSNNNQQTQIELSDDPINSNQNNKKTKDPTKKYLNKKLKYSISGAILFLDALIFMFSNKIVNELGNSTQDESFKDFIKNNEVLSIFFFCASVILFEFIIGLIIGLGCKKGFELCSTEENNTKNKDIELRDIP